MPLPAIITENELWALTLKVERDHGDTAHVHIAERVGLAAMAGDPIGVELWTAVAARYESLRTQSAAYQ